jgi:tetratricopeptide (TPR) repeat protein
MMEHTTDRAWQKQSYSDIYLRHHGFLSHKWTHYPLIYDEILGRHLDIGKPLVLLEIGVQNGGSLEIWKKYLPPGSEIHGMDIDPKCLELDFSAGIQFHHGSATNIDLVNKVFSGKRFDIIVDDGSHICQDVISTFINLFKKLKAGGIYLAEDLHTSYMRAYHGGLLRETSSIEFFKRFIDTLHLDYIAADESSAMADFTPFLSMYRQEIASICFYDSICAIRKFSHPKQGRFQPLTSGETSRVCSIPKRQEWQSHTDDIDAAKAMYAATAPCSIGDESISTLLSQGIEAFNVGCFEQANAIFSDLFHQLPDNPTPSAYLAFICARLGLVDSARDFIAHALEIAPGRADLQAALGETLLSAGHAQYALDYLRTAVSAQPDLWAAYPALAQSLYQTGQGAEAVALLEGVVRIPSAAQAQIQRLLVNILAERGDLAGITRVLLRCPTSLSEDLRLVRYLAHHETDGKCLLATLERIQQQITGYLTAPAPQPAPDAPIHLAFLASDLIGEFQPGKLAALVRHLPAQDFIITLLINDSRLSDENGGPDAVNLCLLTMDHPVLITAGSDGATLEIIHKLAPDILIDLDAYSPEERLGVFARAQVPYKLTWGEAPMPALMPGCGTLAGEKLAVDALLSCTILPGLGEVFAWPDLPLGGVPPGPVFACLSPAIRVSDEGWRLFASVLGAVPASTLLINLKNLGAAARDFIGEQFERAGVSPARLRFVHAESAEALCRLWQDADLGLAPPVDAGELALPAALWMGRPYLTLKSPLPWSRRPAALLEAVGAGQWIAATPQDYAALARRFMENRPPAPDASLRGRMKELGLDDPAAFARGFATAMRKLARAPEGGQT